MKRLPYVTPGSQTWLVAAVDAIIEDRSLSGKEKLVLLVLARHCDARGICFLLKSTILLECRMNKGTLRRAIQRLENKGKLDRIQRRRERQKNESNVYRVRMPVAGGLALGVKTSPPLGVKTSPTEGAYREGSGSSDRSRLSLRSITYPPSHPGERGRGAAIEFSESWISKARRIFPNCHTPTRFLIGLHADGFTEKEGADYLDAAGRATDLPQEDYRALAAWCSAKRRGEWLERRRKRRAQRTVDVPELAASLALPPRTGKLAKVFAMPNPWTARRSRSRS